MFIIKGLTKSGDWESRIIESKEILEVIERAEEEYQIIESIRYYSDKENQEVVEINQSP